jgi:Cu(I)/Ag(I) efflux system membrane fusion protein
MKRVSLGAILVVGLAVAVGSFYLGRVTQPAAMASGPSSAASQPGRTVLYWQDPMVPGQRFDKPGKSPYMDMQLVAVYADSAASSGVQVSAAVQQNLGIRYATVRLATMSSSFDAVGAVQFDERRNVAVQTRVAGYVERLAVRAPMERVRKGQALATVFAPDWIGPQNELIALKRSGVSEDVVAAARARLRALVGSRRPDPPERGGRHRAGAIHACVSRRRGGRGTGREGRRGGDAGHDALSHRRPADRLGGRRGA